MKNFSGERKKRRAVTQEVYNIVAAMSSNEDFSIKKCAQICGIDRKTVRKLVKMHFEGIPFVPASEKCKEACARRNSTFSAIEQTLFNSISCDNFLILEELKEKCFEDVNIKISASSICRKLKKIRITRKRLEKIPEERNSPEKIDARAIFANEIGRIPVGNLVFLDETGFNLHNSRHYGYSLKNERASITVPANKGTNCSLMCAIGFNGAVAYEYKRGAYNSESFSGFIQDKLVPYFRANPNAILIMDNARIHKSKNVLELLTANRIPHRFTTPYSPQLNPIEEFFSMIKSRYATLKHRCPELTIYQCLDTILDENNDYSLQCQSFYSNMLVWLDKARRRENFI